MLMLPHYQLLTLAEEFAIWHRPGCNRAMATPAVSSGDLEHTLAVFVD